MSGDTAPPRINLRLILHLAAAAFGLGVATLGGLLFYFSLDLPTIRTLADYTPPQTTRIYSDDGHLIGELYRERRTVVPPDAVPPHVIHAVLAAEDAGFYEHEGLDYLGILRAAVKNLRPGAHLQGASTLTQQIVKQMVLGPERSYARKMREAILARRLEQMLTKDEILNLYLNQIYFGAGAYGIETAAETYFGKSVRDVDLGEAAYLASIPKHPNRYTLLADPEATKQRQTYVLEQMVKNGWANPEDATAQIEAPVPVPRSAHPHLNLAPYFVEHVRQQLEAEYDEETVYAGGLTVYTGLNTQVQNAAQRALTRGLETLAQERHGYPGAALRLEVDRLDRYLTRLQGLFERGQRRWRRYDGHENADILWDLAGIGEKTLADETLLDSAVRFVPRPTTDRVTGVVTRVDNAAKVAWVDLGCCWGKLTLEQLQWARRFSPRGRTPPPYSPGQVVARGDLVPVELDPEAPMEGEEAGRPVLAVRLVPRPRVEGAVVAIDPHTRFVRAMVGGYAQERGRFNRAVSALRQPGSAFKPMVYATGLASQTIHPGSICPDSPVVIRDPWTGKAWKPENYEDGRYDGNITYRTALQRSKNTCSVKLIERLGPEKVIETARAMGITSPLPSNLTLALGTGDVTPLELANAYATIASGGMFAEPIAIRKVVDIDGTVRVERRATLEPVLEPAVAYVLTHMMRGVVERGTAVRAQALERPLAGKTGTSNESRNVWFSGFSPQLVSTVWVGFDDNTPLGGLTGSNGALPLWIDLMHDALDGSPPLDFVPPEEGVILVTVDPATGEPSDAPGAITEAFLQGTEPSDHNRRLPSIYEVDDALDGVSALDP